MLDPRLRYVVAVARAGSFTAAASVVCVTQSAITKSIADLEREIGYPIFYRTARGVALTEKGSDFIERADRLLEDARELLSADGRVRDPYAGPLRIGIGPASLEWYVVDPLIRLLKRHPAIRFEISGSAFERVVQQLRNGAVDIAIGFDAAFAAWPDLRREPIGTLTGRLFVRLGHPLLAVSDLSRHVLAKFDIVSPSDSRPYGQIFHSLYEEHGIDWRTKLHIVDHFPTVREIVAASDAIGIVDVTYSERSAFQKQFALLPISDLLPTAILCGAVRAKWDPKPAAKAFLTLLKHVPTMRDGNKPRE